MVAETFVMSAGPVQNVMMALPNAGSWKAVGEELRGMFLRSSFLGTCSCSVGECDAGTWWAFGAVCL